MLVCAFGAISWFIMSFLTKESVYFKLDTGKFANATVDTSFATLTVVALLLLLRFLLVRF